MSQPPSEAELAASAPVGDRTRRFVDALARAEAVGDPEELVALFSDRAELRSLLHHEPRLGIDGARLFWTEYLGSFRERRSRFERAREVGDLAVLEWVTDATTRSGASLRYAGVSLLEFEGDRIARFSTYYDSAALAGRDRAAPPTH